MRKYLLHFGFLFQDILFAKYLNNSLLYGIIFIKWRYIPLLCLSIFILIISRLNFNYDFLDFVPLLVIVLSWCILISLLSFRPEKIRLRTMLTLVVITVFLDLLQVNLYLSSLVDARYSGFWDNGRIAGMSREPSYFADYVFVVYIALFALKRFSLGLIYLILLYVLTWANSLLLYFVAFHTFYAVMRLYKPNMHLRMSVSLIIIPLVVSFCISASGFAEWTFEAHGSWRTISNDLALKHASFIPSPMSDFFIYGIGKYNINWLAAIFGYFSIVIYSLGWFGGSLAYWFTCFLFWKLSRAFFVDKRSWRVSYAAFLVFVLFAPKWNLILLLTPIILKGFAINSVRSIRKS